MKIKYIFTVKKEQLTKDLSYKLSKFKINSLITIHEDYIELHVFDNIYRITDKRLPNVDYINSECFFDDIFNNFDIKKSSSKKSIGVSDRPGYKKYTKELENNYRKNNNIKTKTLIKNCGRFVVK